MNEQEVSQQIENMCRFIRQEAEEKANEIQVSAEEEFNLEKLQLLEQEKSKIRKEYERREGLVEVKKKIEYSKQLNEQRIHVLTAREEAIQDVLVEAKLRLRDVARNPSSYNKLLIDFLVQAMRKLKEPTALVRCRQVDVPLVQQSLEASRSRFASLFQEEAPTLTLDGTTFLPPPTKTGREDEVSSCGGVVVLSTDARIVVRNTLEDRLKITYEANLPVIRARLFSDTVEA